MPLIVILAEIATVGFLGLFCFALATSDARGPIFSIGTKDPVARALIRSTQAAFVIGYGALFIISAFEVAAH